MRQQFYSQTIQSNFIKALLNNTPLPINETVSFGDFIIKDFIYIYQCTLIRCTVTGYIGDNARWSPLEHYSLNQYRPQLNQYYHSTYRYYDSKTHEKLGQLLRCYRDMKYINLMPFYNCFSGTYFSGIKIDKSGVQTTKKTIYKTVKIPIRFNTKYTIALDCAASVYIAPAFFSNENFTIIPQYGVDEPLNLTDEICKIANNVKYFSSTSFKHPIVYEVKNVDANCGLLYTYHRDLYMLIQIPANNNSSIVVLEGDYTTVDFSKTFNAEYINELSNTTLDQLLISSLSLLQFSDKQNYSFSDRLIEYLLWNVISHRDDISNNVIFAQTCLSSAYKITNRYSVWDRQLRYELFQAYMASKKTNKLDIVGYVDKDVENYLLRRYINDKY